MPGMTGFEVLRALPADISPAIIFTTAHDEFALEAFDVNAADYLLKPFKLARFQQAVERARRACETRTTEPAKQRLTQWLDQKLPLPPGQKRIMVRTNDRVIFVRLDDIDWIEAAGNYAILHVGKSNHILRETMTHLEDQLPLDLFFRASRSAFIHLARIRELQPLPGGQHVVILQDGQKITMTRPPARHPGTPRVALSLCGKGCWGRGKGIARDGNPEGQRASPRAGTLDFLDLYRALPPSRRTLPHQVPALVDTFGGRP
jgi:two-component system LytT family response regulator